MPRLPLGLLLLLPLCHGDAPAYATLDAVDWQQPWHLAGTEEPPPVAPHIPSNLTTTNVFWPGEKAADGTVYGCVYLPTMVLANETRLIVHGRCYTDAQAKMSTECGGYHVSAAGRSLLAESDRAADLGTVDLGPITLCQKHSDE
jgi:hypothetical protein